MKILYGIQGTGHGHISRARELLPELSKHVSVDVIVSGCTKQPNLNEPIKYNKYGVSLTYDSNGGVAVLDTLLDFRPIRFVSDIQSISITDYDLVISDYEPISAWSAKLEQVPSVALSHQAAFLSLDSPRPKRRSLVAETLLRHFAPAKHSVGFHFKRYDNFIKPPIIRREIRNMDVSEENHIIVYLPAYHHKVLQNIFTPFTHVDWHIFSPTCSKTIENKNFQIHPVSNQSFLDSFASCKGVVCNAGFETCAEAMYLGKKLLAVPIHNQYEQECNAAALSELGVLTLDSLQGKIEELWHWLENRKMVQIDEIANPKKIIRHILDLELTLPRKTRKIRSIFNVRL